MRNIKRSFVLLLVFFCLLWWFADQTEWSAIPNFFGWRALLMQFSGVLGIGVMSVAMVLAVRPVVFEPYLGGLDKMYRLHKWLGISGLIIALSHWLISEAPKWLVGLGLLERPVRGARASLPGDAVQQFFSEPALSGRGNWQMGLLCRCNSDGAGIGETVSVPALFLKPIAYSL